MEGSKAGSVQINDESGSRRPMNIRILRIRLRNTSYEVLAQFLILESYPDQAVQDSK
jgi:hypothetical protein